LTFPIHSRKIGISSFAKRFSKQLQLHLHQRSCFTNKAASEAILEEAEAMPNEPLVDGLICYSHGDVDRMMSSCC